MKCSPLRLVVLLLGLCASAWAQEPVPGEDVGRPEQVVAPGTEPAPEARPDALPGTVTEGTPAETAVEATTTDPTAAAASEASPEVEAPPPTPANPGPTERVVSGIRGDVVGGGWIAAAIINGIASTVARTSRGEEADDAARHALRDLGKAEFLVGSLVAGSAGAAIGAALPVPGLSRAPLFVRTLGAAFAPLMLASVFQTVTTNAISLHRQKKLTPGNLMRSIDWTSLGAQSVGSLMGMALGATMVSRGWAPAARIGAVVLVPLAGGILGAIGGAQALHWIRKRRMKPEDAAGASTGAPSTGPDVPGSRGSRPGGGRAPAPPLPDVITVDPMVDIHIAEPPVRAR